MDLAKVDNARRFFGVIRSLRRVFVAGGATRRCRNLRRQICPKIGEIVAYFKKEKIKAPCLSSNPGAPASQSGLQEKPAKWAFSGLFNRLQIPELGPEQAVFAGNLTRKINYSRIAKAPFQRLSALGGEPVSALIGCWLSA